MTATGAKIGKDSIGGALGRIASGVYVVTVGDKNERDGMLATWVNQTSFEPPMVAVAVKKERHILVMMQPGHSFTVNVLGKSNREEYKNFVKPYSEGLDRFAGLNVTQKENAAAVLSDSIAYLSCQVRSLLDAGDHVLVLGEVIEGGLLKGEEEPMVHFRKNGFQY